MLFSHPEVSAFVSQNFLAAWESLRPVPTATIDFGDGRVALRTMNGNIATYVCTPSGHVVDVIAGLVSPELYLAKLHDAVESAERLVDPAVEVPAWHRARMLDLTASHLAAIHLAALLQTSPAVAATQSPPNTGLFEAASKSIVETPTKAAFALEPALLEIEDAQATFERDHGVHRLLASRLVEPRDIQERLYRDVLHVDLADPWLGLAIDVFDGGAYPRAD